MNINDFAIIGIMKQLRVYFREAYNDDPTTQVVPNFDVPTTKLCQANQSNVISSTTIEVNMQCVIKKIGNSSNPLNGFLSRLNQKSVMDCDELDSKHIFRLQFGGGLSRIMISVRSEVCSAYVVHNVIKKMSALMCCLKINKEDLKQIIEKTFVNNAKLSNITNDINN